jgi:hypothetical protein
VLLLDRLPRGSRSAAQTAQSLHRFLQLGNSGFVIVLAGQGIAAYGGDLSPETLDGIAQNAARTIDSENHAAGIAQIVRSADQERGQIIALSARLFLAALGLLAGGVYLLMRRNRKREAAGLAEARSEAQQLSNRLAAQLETLDTDFERALLAEKDATRKAQLFDNRHEAGEAFTGATRRLREAQTIHQFKMALASLQNAQNTLQRARNVLQSRPDGDTEQDTNQDIEPADAPASTHEAQNDSGLNSSAQCSSQHSANGSAEGDDNVTDDDTVIQVPPLGLDLPGARSGYALDFFTSEPVPRDEMVPVDLEINGQKRRVWASPDSAQRAVDGPPPIATIEEDGQARAWFDVPSYNAWQSYGSPALQITTMHMLLGQMPEGCSLGSARSGPGANSGGWFDRDYQGDLGSDRAAGRDNEGVPLPFADDNQTMHHSSTQASRETPFRNGSHSSGDTAGSAVLDVVDSGASSGRASS